MRTIDEARLRAEYAPKEKTPLDEALRLDRKAKLPAHIFAYTFGVIGALILGIGMCFAMKVIGDGTDLMMYLGSAIGVVGIVMVSVNYPLFKKQIRRGKEKYGSTIMVLLNKNAAANVKVSNAVPAAQNADATEPTGEN